MSDVYLHRLTKLDPATFEHFVCDAVAELTGVRVYRSKAGHQGGLDGRVDGNGGACIECKRYTTGRLSDRELLGEVHEAARSGCDLWTLAATCAVSEQTARKLQGAAADLGLVVLILDCPDGQRRPLELLAIGAPRAAKRYLGLSRSDLRRLSGNHDGDDIDRLKAQIATPLLSIEQLRARLWHSYDEIVRDSSRFRELGVRAPQPSDHQGERFDGYVRRSLVEQQLDAWLDANDDASGRPAVMLGDEGVGKSLTALHWLHGRASAGDLVFVVRSGFPVATDDPYALLSELARSMFGESADRWRKRLMAFFSSDAASRINTVVYLDGINEQPDAPWSKLIEALQAGLFRGKLRILLSCRPWPYRYRLRSIDALEPRPLSIPVSLFNDDELAEILLMHGRRLSEFPTAMHPLLARPRLMAMALRNEVALKASGEFTPTRLFWEDWKDRIEAHRDIINENQFRAALATLAGSLDRHRGQKALRMQHRDLAEALDHSQFFLRPSPQMEQSYSEIVDGGLARLDDDMDLHLDPTFAAMALGLELRLVVRKRDDMDYAALKDFARQTLEPWGGADFGAQVARFSVWASVETTTPVAVVAALLALWLEQQNFAETDANDANAVVGKRTDAAFAVAQDLWFSSPDKAALALQRAFERALSPAAGNGASRLQMIAYVLKWMGEIAVDRLLNDDDGSPVGREVALARLGARVGRALEVGDGFELLGETLCLVDDELQDGQNAATLGLDALAATGAIDLAAVVRKSAVVTSVAYPEDLLTACGRLLRRLEPQDLDLVRQLEEELPLLRLSGDEKLGAYDTLAYLMDLPRSPSGEPLHPLVTTLWPAASQRFQDRLSAPALLAKVDKHLLIEALLEPDVRWNEELRTKVEQIATTSGPETSGPDFPAVIDAATILQRVAYKDEPAVRFRPARQPALDSAVDIPDGTADLIADVSLNPADGETDKRFDALFAMSGGPARTIHVRSGNGTAAGAHHGEDGGALDCAFVVAAFATAPDRLDHILHALSDRRAVVLDHLLEARPGLLLSLVQAAMVLERPRVWPVWQLCFPIRERFVLQPDERNWYFDLPFQAKGSVSSNQAREVALELADTETRLLDIVLSARQWRRQDWLEARIATDLSSGVAWRACRAMVLTGMLGDDPSDLAIGRTPAPEWLDQASLAGFRYWRREERMRFWIRVAADNGPAAEAARRIVLADGDRRLHVILAEAIEPAGELLATTQHINGPSADTSEFGYFTHFLGIPPHPWLGAPGTSLLNRDFLWHARR